MGVEPSGKAANNPALTRPAGNGPKRPPGRRRKPKKKGEIMKEVRWLTEKELHPGLAGKCDAELASDEMDQWELGIKCSKMAEVHITFNSGNEQRTCHHHYITRTAFPDREIQGTPVH